MRFWSSIVLIIDISSISSNYNLFNFQSIRLWFSKDHEIFRDTFLLRFQLVRTSDQLDCEECLVILLGLINNSSKIPIARKIVWIDSYKNKVFQIDNVYFRLADCR